MSKPILTEVQLEKATKMGVAMAKLDMEANGGYHNAPYTVGSNLKARIRYITDRIQRQGNQQIRQEVSLEIYQPETVLNSTVLCHDDSLNLVS